MPVGVKPIAPVPSGCVDTPPPDSAYTCAEQASFGKCNEDFMKDFCNVSCNRCPGGASPAVVAAPPSPSPSPTGGHARSHPLAQCEHPLAKLQQTGDPNASWQLVKSALEIVNAAVTSAPTHLFSPPAALQPQAPARPQHHPPAPAQLPHRHHLHLRLLQAPSNRPPQHPLQRPRPRLLLGSSPVLTAQCPTSAASRSGWVGLQQHSHGIS